MEGSTEYIIDDTPVHIPEEVRAMPTEQLDAEIRRRKTMNQHGIHTRIIQ